MEVGTLQGGGTIFMVPYIDIKVWGWRGLMIEGVHTASSTWWRDLCRVCGGQNKSLWFNECVEWKVGRGDRIFIWHDIWNGHDSLVHVFPLDFF